MKHHDYLPFGEELYAGVSGRTAQQGYSGGDGIRQQFTSKERDIETGLDYSRTKQRPRVLERRLALLCAKLHLVAAKC